jgi:site-specific DNA-methyltransferase (adenine-specific)
VNYLTNCREIALVGIKKSKPTFNSKYDGIYFPLTRRKNRFLPKKVCFFIWVIKKHSNENDVVDTFLGAGTTANCVRTPNEDLGVW